MEDSERLAIAAHLHVLLRRKTGRVTDTEWMASNEAYALAMVVFAQEHAREKQDEELGRLAQRLQESWTGKPPQRTGSAATQEDNSVATKAAEMLRTSARYIGGLR